MSVVIDKSPVRAVSSDHACQQFLERVVSECSNGFEEPVEGVITSYGALKVWSMPVTVRLECHVLKAWKGCTLSYLRQAMLGLFEMTCIPEDAELTFDWVTVNLCRQRKARCVPPVKIVPSKNAPIIQAPKNKVKSKVMKFAAKAIGCIDLNNAVHSPRFTDGQPHAYAAETFYLQPN